MYSEQQYEQLLLQYNQLKAGAENIASMIENENFDEAITFLQSREQLFLSCKNILRYLELTDEQQKVIDNVINELRELEQKNIAQLQEGMNQVQAEITKTQKSQKLQNTYTNTREDDSGSILNIEE